jgi:hypothetical protein
LRFHAPIEALLDGHGGVGHGRDVELGAVGLLPGLAVVELEHGVAAPALDRALDARLDRAVSLPEPKKPLARKPSSAPPPRRVRLAG